MDRPTSPPAAQIEDEVAQRLLRAAVDLLVAQRHSQPVAYPALAEAAGALDLQLTVTLSHAPRGAVVRLSMVDPMGREVLLARRLEMVPATNVPAPRAVQ